jgi:AbrB family looped-hinge helix DNA binding protein
MRLESKKVGKTERSGIMIIELRKKSQITIPKAVIDELQLKEGDHLSVTVQDGAIHIEPVAVYSKAYVKKLEDSVTRINEDSVEYNVGPFTSVEEAIEFLESSKDDNKKESKKKK